MLQQATAAAAHSFACHTLALKAVNRARNTAERVTAEATAEAARTQDEYFYSCRKGHFRSHRDDGDTSLRLCPNTPLLSIPPKLQSSMLG